MEVRKLRFPGSDEISFEVRRGEILGVAGLVGAKRTESFLSLIGRDPSIEKEVLFEGRPIEMRSPHEALSHGIGYLPEDRKRTGLFLPFSIRSNIVISTLNRLTNKLGMVLPREEKTLSDRFIKRMRIRTTSDLKTVSELSGGNQQKVIIARWLASNCKLLIFDEPTRGIDVGAKAEIYVMLQELAAQGLGVVVISSDLPEVIGLCDRVLVMRYGSIRATLTGADINSEKIMIYASGGENG
jgi:monosaccharide ABC transporter ATP-binding protein, CUT2 family (TC 3.A.1.2.-)